MLLSSPDSPDQASSHGGSPDRQNINVDSAKVSLPSIPTAFKDLFHHESCRASAPSINHEPSTLTKAPALLQGPCIKYSSHVTRGPRAATDMQQFSVGVQRPINIIVVRTANLSTPTSSMGCNSPMTSPEYLPCLHGVSSSILVRRFYS